MTPLGRDIASVSRSPGQGRHSRPVSASVVDCTAGMPWGSRCQIGPTPTRQCSTQAVCCGACSSRRARLARVERQRISLCWGPRLTSTLPLETRMSPVVTDSPVTRGTRSITALPAGVSRTTLVCTSQVRPSTRLRSTRTKGGNASATNLLALPDSASRVNCRLASTRPSS